MDSMLVASAYCNLAVAARRDQAESFDVLRRRIWENAGRTPVLESDIAEILRVRPGLIEPWISFSEDQRNGDAWYFLGTTDSQSRAWIVGHSHGDTYMEYTDRARACAAFIARIVGEPYVTPDRC